MDNEERYKDCHELGGMSNWAYLDDPKRLAFTLARYKHTAKLLEGFGTVLEVGCSDGRWSRIVRQHVEQLLAIDNDAASIKEAARNNSERWPIDFQHMNFMEADLHSFDAIYALDVFEHVHPTAEDEFLWRFSEAAPVAVIGVPSLESQQYASQQSRDGHVNCVLPGALVEGRAVGALKSLYAGPVVEVITSKGNRLSLTVNHPVMTTWGWIKAHALCEGMELVRNTHDVWLPSNIDNDQYPALVENIFAAFEPLGGSKVVMTVDDLHGDARFVKGDIHVVFADRRLLRCFQAERAESSSNTSFIVTDVREALMAGVGPRTKYRQGILLPAPSGVSLSNLFSPRASRHLRKLYERRLGVSANWHTVPLQKSHDGTIVNPEFLSKLLRRGAGQIETDKVVGLRRFEYVGHVYDLQTVEGYYSANGLYISNCRTGADLRAILKGYWKQVFLFSMNDEAIGTGFLPMAHYLLALCVK